MSSSRPDPDALLRQVQAEERKQKRGRLTVFFGSAPGVGKTFSMLLEAGYLRDVEGREVVAGVVETHGRFDTTTLLANFERLPKKKISYRARELEEFDLDAALARKPSLLLLDELAHTNVEGSRHPKRWQDVEELLDAGIEVYTTLNVQHLESVGDVVAQVTGVVVKETVPDSVFDAAGDVKLVDLPPDELLERLKEGKVYVAGQAERAADAYFRKGNLIALRELALRKTAERVDADMQAYRRAHGIEKTWAASDRLLVCISASPFSANLLRVGRRMASGLRAQWYAAAVETGATLRLPERDRARLSENLRLAEQLGAEAVTLTGESAAAAILRFAREQNVTKIVAGKPRIVGWRDRFGVGFVDQLIRDSRDIDIYVTVGDETKIAAEAGGDHPPPAKSSNWEGYAAGAAVTVLATVVAALLFGRSHLADVVMTYLLGIVLVSMRFDFRVALATAVMSVLAFDFFFIPPYLTFSVSDLRHTITFGVMLFVAVVVAGLTNRVKEQAAVARHGERRTAVLYALSRELAQATTAEAMMRAACRQLEEVFDARAVVFTRDGGEHTVAYATTDFQPPVEKEMGTVSWVWNNRREAGLGTNTVPGAMGLYLPLIASGADNAIMGVVGVYPDDPTRFTDPEQRRLADALASQLAMALERAELADQTQRGRLEIEAERLRSTLLSSVSHDLRTPLAVMKGAASTLVDDDRTLSQGTRSDLAQTILEETDRLERLVRNLLDMTRLESGAVQVHKEWQSVEEAVGGALSRVESRLGGREVTTKIPADLLAPFDGVLIEQLLVNLLENAAKHTPPGTPLEINAGRQDREVLVEVADRGPGLLPGEEERVFEKFHRVPAGRPIAGVGLGLTICRAIATAHGGRMWAENRPGGGAVLRFALPLAGEPPNNTLPELTEERTRALT